jgi:hypothetical protein
MQPKKGETSATTNYEFSKKHALCMKLENQQDATIRYLLLTSITTCFGHHYAHLQENKEPVTAFGVLFWFCWMWLGAVVGRCLEGSEHYEGFCSTSNCCILLVFSLHILLTMHGHRYLKRPMCGSLMTFIQINTLWYAKNKPFKSYSRAPTYIENRAQFVEGAISAKRNSI